MPTGQAHWQADQSTQVVKRWPCPQRLFRWLNETEGVTSVNPFAKMNPPQVPCGTASSVSGSDRGRRAGLVKAPVVGSAGPSLVLLSSVTEHRSQ
jgi:hypothetical protein